MRTDINYQALSRIDLGGPKTVREWWDNLPDEAKNLVAPIIIHSPAPTAKLLLSKHADFPFGTTALKDFRRQLKEGTVN